MANAHDVAAYILAKAGPLSAMKMQKLCFYSQAWSLVWDEEPLFTERIEAWANGPVVRSLYAQHRGQWEIHSWPSGNADNLTPDQKASVDAVLDAYGKLTAQQLSDLTHSERPWIKARAGLPPTVRSEAEITRESMRDFYASLASRSDTETV
ncbi:Panacea domain-containing protein [Streptomyces rochei]|uniref:Panacea domain-containing protein n=1 Tax=Streptomyces rochei TaxID=1928 RepID=UPI0036ABCE85